MGRKVRRHLRSESGEIDGGQPPNASTPASRPLPSSLDEVRAMTPARVFTGRAGAAYKTTTWLKLRVDHALARDAVFAEIDLLRDLGEAFVDEWSLFEVATLAQTKTDYLLRPELGRSLSATAKTELKNRCASGADLQIAIADGLSATAVRAGTRALASARGRSWEARLEVRPAIPDPSCSGGNLERHRRSS